MAQKMSRRRYARMTKRGYYLASRRENAWFEWVGFHCRNFRCLTNEIRQNQEGFERACRRKIALDRWGLLERSSHTEKSWKWKSKKRKQWMKD